MGIRIRACGLIHQNGYLAMVKLHSPVINEPIWMSPGGGVNENESIYDAVQRECLEEVNLRVNALDVLYVHELIKGAIHAIEFYVKCELIEGELSLGSDPERTENPLLLDAKWMALSTFPENKMIRPAFLQNELSDDLLNWNGKTRFYAHNSYQ